MRKAISLHPSISSNDQCMAARKLSCSCSNRSNHSGESEARSRPALSDSSMKYTAWALRTAFISPLAPRSSNPYSRIVSNIANLGSSPFPCSLRRNKLLSTSEATLSRINPVALPRTPLTTSIASSVQPPTKSESRRKSSCSCASKRL